MCPMRLRATSARTMPRRASNDARDVRTSELGSEAALTPAHGRALSAPEYVKGVTPPPTPMAVAEVRPSAPSAAHVWVPGHHTRRYGQWVWVKGRYDVPPEAGLVWVPGHWVDHGSGYVWIEGGWR